MSEHSMIRALRNRNYRLFFSGQSISLIGTWLTRIATSWLVFNLSHSAWVLGLVSFIGQIPTFVFAPVSGVLVDRWNRHHVLVITQILAMIQSFLLALLTLTNQITIPHILALSLFQGMINTFDTPARQAFVVDMIEDRQDLPNAIALNSSMVNMAKLVGPSVAGLLIAFVGIGWCFGIDALSYVAVIGSLLFMQLKVSEKESKKRQSLWQEMAEGLQYALAFSPIRSILLLLALVSLMGAPYMVLLPIVASHQLHGNAMTLGYLTAATGLGALAGVFYLASKHSVLGLGNVIAISSAVFGLGLMAFAWCTQLWLSLVFLFVTGLGMMLNMAACNTILQTIVDEDKRGRVMSLYTMAVFGMLPFGSLFSGWLASRIGTPETLFCSGMVCVLGAILFLRSLPKIREQVRPIYVRIGVLPEIATALQNVGPLNVPPED